MKMNFYFIVVCYAENVRCQHCHQVIMSTNVNCVHMRCMKACHVSGSLYECFFEKQCEIIQGQNQVR